MQDPMHDRMRDPEGDTMRAIVGGTVMPVERPPIEGGRILIRGGRILAVGGGEVSIPADAEIVDAAGCVVVPGLIDAHTHVGLHEEAEGWAGLDVNETTDPNTAEVRALDGINPADQGFADAIAGGVLAVNVNPGSANPIGGQTVAIRTWGRSVDEMVLRSPSGLKSALGENPKRVHGDRHRAPSTRLGTAAVIRKALQAARNYENRRAHRTAETPEERDLQLEALARVLAREIPWRQHCHRADDIATALRLAEEFGYDLVLDHGTEAHLLADVIAAREIPVVIGPLLTSRSKVELRQRSLRNPGRLARAGVRIAITTDHPVVPLPLLVVQAALAVRDGLDPATALRALTLTPAEIMGVADRLGSLSPGKDADLCIWSGDPLDIRSHVRLAIVRGRTVYRRGPHEAEGELVSPVPAHLRD